MSVTVMARPLAFQTFLIAAPSVEYWKPSSDSRGDTICASSGCRSSMSSSMSSTRERVERQRGVLGELDEAAAEIAASLLVGAADVDDPDPRAGAG